MAIEHRSRGDELTQNEAKARMYARDPYFREAWADVCAAWGLEADGRLRQIAVVIFKPETIVTQKVGPGLQLLREHGFVPVWCSRIAYTRHMNRAAWRYQYQVDLPSVDRLAVNDLLLSATDALCLVLHDIEPNPTQPASVRINTLKGSMTPALRQQGDLRAVVGGPNRMLSGVHIPDEPADVVRELGILFDVEMRPGLLKDVERRIGCDLSTAFTTQVDAMIEGLYCQYPVADLDPEAALARLQVGVAEMIAVSGQADATVQLHELLVAVAAGQPLPWLPFLSLMGQVGLAAPLWDRILLGTHYIQHEADA